MFTHSKLVGSNKTPVTESATGTPLLPPADSPVPCITHQCVPLHVFAAGELLPTDLAGVGPLARVRAHVPLQDALVHSREAAVRALEFLPDYREVVYYREKEERFRRFSQQQVLYTHNFTVLVVQKDLMEICHCVV